MRRMFVFPWQGHYEEYYVMGCGGYVGSPLGTACCPLWHVVMIWRGNASLRTRAHTHGRPPLTLSPSRPLNLSPTATVHTSADPWRPWPVDREFIPPVTMVVYQNETVVLPGDSVSLTLDYTCNSNHCSAAVGSHTLSVLAAGVAVLVSFVLM